MNKPYNFFQASLFGDIQTPKLNNGREDITPRYRDVHFLITQRSLEALDPSALSKYLEPLTHASSSDLSLTDDQLSQVVQSRYIQQPSDVQAFAKYLTDTANDIKSRFTDYETKQKKWSSFLTNFQRSQLASTAAPPAAGPSSKS